MLANCNSTISLLLKFFLVFLFIIADVSGNDENGRTIPFSRYNSSKNIVFGAFGGGRSHLMWVFEILEEAHTRGHQVSFYSREDQLQFAKDYPVIKTKQVGGSSINIHDHPLVSQHYTKHANSDQGILGDIYQVALLNYTEEVKHFTALFETENIDLVICDGFALSCTDSAIYSKIPLIITSTFGKSTDLNTAYQISDELYCNTYGTSSQKVKGSVWERMYRKDFYRPFIYMLNKFSILKGTGQLSSSDNDAEKASSLSSSTRFDHVHKMINNVFGIEASDNYRPLVHMIGPVMRKSYAPLDTNIKSFLSSHKRVAFIAFGQHTKPTSEDVKMMLSGLLRLLESGSVDGVIWAGLSKSSLPSEIQTPNSNDTYSYHDLIGHPDLYLTDWAPQFAILQHSSVSFFISHGGVGSLHEAYYSGKRVLLYPFFGDQPINARSIQHYGIGIHFDAFDMKFDTACYESFYNALYQIAVDPGNTIQDNVDRYSAYFQIRAKHAVSRGADVLEESLFASDSDGRLTFLEGSTADQETIHWIKNLKIDIYTVIILLLSLIAFKKLALPVK